VWFFEPPGWFCPPTLFLHDWVAPFHRVSFSAPLFQKIFCFWGLGTAWGVGGHSHKTALLRHCPPSFLVDCFLQCGAARGPVFLPFPFPFNVLSDLHFSRACWFGFCRPFWNSPLLFFFLFSPLFPPFLACFLTICPVR